MVTAAEDNRIEVWEAIGAGKPVRMGTAVGSVSEVALSPDGVLIAAAGREGAGLWHTPSRRRIAAVATGGQRHALAFTSGRRCVAAAGGGRTLRLWDVISASPLAEVVLDGVAADVSITDDAARVGALDASGQIHVWRLNEAARQALQEPFNSERLAALLAKAPPQPQQRKGVLKRLTEALPFRPDSSTPEEKRE